MILLKHIQWVVIGDLLEFKQVEFLILMLCYDHESSTLTASYTSFSVLYACIVYVEVSGYAYIHFLHNKNLLSGVCGSWDVLYYVVDCLAA